MEYILLILGFGVLTFGADWLVKGASAVAKKFNISNLVIGLTVVALGTSAPELVVNIVASAKESTDIALTNILGSNIINTLVILGFTSLIFPIACQRSTFRIEIPYSLLAGSIVLLMGTNYFGLVSYKNGFVGISHFDGIVLIIFFITFLTYTFFQARKDKKNMCADETDDELCKMSLWKSIILIIAGLSCLVYGGNLIVDSAVIIAQAWGCNKAFIGVTIVALGTSLPELATSIMAAYRKNTDIAIGNVIGSNIFNVFFVLGLSATIHPLENYSSIVLDSAIAAGSSLLLLLLLALSKKKTLTRWSGAILLLTYGVYLGYLLATLS